MNTRMFWTPGGWWFGGGSDLNPMIEDAADTAFFHAALQARLRRARSRRTTRGSRPGPTSTS